MKKIYYYFITIIIVTLTGQPFITQFFISDYKWVSLISFISLLIIIYPIVRVYQIIKSNVNYEIAHVLKASNLLEEEMKRLYKSTKSQFIFYKHQPKEAFVELSASVENILGTSVEDFKINYKKHKAEVLFENAFDRVADFNKKGIRVPVYEIELTTKKGIFVKFEVTETPIFNRKKELIGVWGSLYKVLDKETNIEYASNRNTALFNLLYNNMNDGVLLIQGDRFVECNNKALEIYNASIDQLLMYTPFSNKFSPEVQPSGRNSKEEALSLLRLTYEGQAQTFNWKHFKLGGAPFYAEIKLKRYNSSGSLYILAIVKDITEQFNFNNTLKEKDNIINLIYQQSEVSSLRYDSNFIITEYNSNFSDNFEKGIEIIDLKVNQVFHNETLNQMLDLSKEQALQSNTIKLFNSNHKQYKETEIKVIALYENDVYSGGLIMFEKWSVSSPVDDTPKIL